MKYGVKFLALFKKQIEKENKKLLKENIYYYYITRKVLQENKKWKLFITLIYLKDVEVTGTLLRDTRQKFIK